MLAQPPPPWRHAATRFFCSLPPSRNINYDHFTKGHRPEVFAGYQMQNRLIKFLPLAARKGTPRDMALRAQYPSTLEHLRALLIRHATNSLAFNRKRFEAPWMTRRWMMRDRSSLPLSRVIASLCLACTFLGFISLCDRKWDSVKLKGG